MLHNYVIHLLGGLVLLAEDVVDLSEDRVRSSIARQLTKVHRVVRQQDSLLSSSERMPGFSVWAGGLHPGVIARVISEIVNTTVRQV